MTAPRLCRATLSRLPAQVQRPAYDYPARGVGIVHLGIGAFHRAHQALYTDQAMACAGGDWRICGVSLRGPAVRDSLQPQDNLYTVLVRSSARQQARVVGSVAETLLAPENPRAVIERLATAAVHVVTLTITEKGYCLHPASGELDLSHPDIVHDLKQGSPPRSAIGLLAAGLDRRRRAGLSGLTLLSCDNLSGNGRKLAAAVAGFARRSNPGLADWIAARCTFPCTMVDRIVPATTAADLAQLAAETGLEDRAAVVTEPFSQWVIEENFAGPVPDWGRVGAELVADVAPFEEMKLRLLNASHSTLAYLGCLAGRATVAEMLEDPAVPRLLGDLMGGEMAPTLSGLGNFDLEAYCSSLLERFANRGLKHLTRQIAMDGSQKVPQRLLPGLLWHRQRGDDCKATSFGVAAWLYFLYGECESGREETLDDPLAALFTGIRAECGTDLDAWLERLLGLDQIFPPVLARDETVKKQLQAWLVEFHCAGVLATLHRHWGGEQAT